MKRLAGIIVAIAAGLSIVVGSIGLLRDAGLFVAPPEAVAEGFVRQLVAGRYERAMSYLDRSMHDELSPEDLKHFAIFIMMSGGEVLDVRAERAWVKGSTAEAHAHLVTAISGDWALSLKMVRTGGSWVIAGIGSMERSGNGGTQGLFGTRIPPAIVMAGDGAPAHATG